MALQIVSNDYLRVIERNNISESHEYIQPVALQSKLVEHYETDQIKILINK